MRKFEGCFNRDQELLIFDTAHGAPRERDWDL